MQHIKKATLLVIGLLCFHCFVAYADNNKSYLLFETDRMLRYEYKATGDTDIKPFIDYHIRMERGTRILFRVDPSQKTIISKPPQKIHQAGDTELFKPKFREMVNKNFLEMAVLTANDEGYISQPVQEIIIFEETGNAIEFKDRSLSFRYNFDYTYENGENLRFDANGYGILFFLEKGEQACLERRTFRFHGELSSEVYKNVTFLNKVGLWSITEGASQEGIYLNRVNSLTAQAFIKQICTTGEVLPSPKGNNEKLSIGEVLANTSKQNAPETNLKKETLLPSKTTAVDTAKPKDAAYFPKPNTVKPWEMTFNNGTSPKAAAAKTSSKTKPLAPGYHRVKTGETLSSISLKYNIAEDCLMEANNMTDEKLTIGQDLLVAIGEEYQCPLPYRWVEDKANNRMLLYHIVHRGEDLFRIAKNYGTTVEQIQNWNKLDNPNALQVRQELIVRIKSDN